MSSILFIQNICAGLLHSLVKQMTLCASSECHLVGTAQCLYTGTGICS